MMAGLWKALVVVVALAVVFSGAHRPPNYDDIVAQALKFYNNGQQGKPLFRLLQATPPSGREVRNCTGEFLRRGHTRSLTLSCYRDHRREVAQVSSFADYPVAEVPKEDGLAELPPASNDIISNILGNI